MIKRLSMALPVCLSGLTISAAAIQDTPHAKTTHTNWSSRSIL